LFLLENIIFPLIFWELKFLINVIESHKYSRHNSFIYMFNVIFLKCYYPFKWQSRHSFNVIFFSHTMLFDIFSKILVYVKIESVNLFLCSWTIMSINEMYYSSRDSINTLNYVLIIKYTLSPFFLWPFFCWKVRKQLDF
jgi:hypothetical protein